MVDWLRVGADMEQLATQTLSAGKRLVGLNRPTVIQPYRGFVADGVANVRARLLEKPMINAGPEGLRIDATLAANLLRWVVLDVPGVPVIVTVAGQSVEAMSNAEGFVIAKVEVGDLDPGWHSVELSALDASGPLRATGRVVRPDRTSGIGFISDIDDTVLRTGMTEGLKAVQRTLLRDAHGRKPVPGTPSLYRGLARGTGGHPESTFFYVSAGPWNLYDMLIQFLGVRGFPRGPLFMTDWRPGPSRLLASSSEHGSMSKAHKRARIRRLLDSYPELRFVLLGDSGEHDPVVYQEFLDSDPDRIIAAFVRDVDAPAGSGLGVAVDGTPDTSRVITVHDSIELAEIAHRLGLIDELTVEEVHTEIDAQF